VRVGRFNLIPNFIPLQDTEKQVILEMRLRPKISQRKITVLYPQSRATSNSLSDRMSCFRDWPRPPPSLLLAPGFGRAPWHAGPHAATRLLPNEADKERAPASAPAQAMAPFDGHGQGVRGAVGRRTHGCTQGSQTPGVVLDGAAGNARVKAKVEAKESNLSRPTGHQDRAQWR